MGAADDPVLEVDQVEEASSDMERCRKKAVNLMRDRLMKLLCGVECDGEETFGNCPQRRDGKCRTVQKLEMCQIGAIADYLLANGVIVPPCKVGDTVYEIEKQCLSCKHYSDAGYTDWCECMLDDNKIMFTCDFDKDCRYNVITKRFNFGMMEQFGKTIFLNREEAERVLKGGESDAR